MLKNRTNEATLCGTNRDNWSGVKWDIEKIQNIGFQRLDSGILKYNKVVHVRKCKKFYKNIIIV